MIPLMRLENVAAKYGEKSLFSPFSVTVHAGRITAVMGPNGAGKSSLLLAMAGMLPYLGTIQLKHGDVHQLTRAEMASQIAWMGALPSVDFGLTVRQRLQLASEGREIGSAARTMEIEYCLDRSLATLSSGELQRCELAALLLRAAPLWLIDEPTAHLDLRHQVRAMQKLRDEATRGRGVVVVLHDIQQAVAVADDVILIGDDGQVESGSASSLLTREHLEKLFAAPLISCSAALIPDYAVVAL